MASDLEAKAKEAFIDDYFELSVELYTQAIALSPKKAELYVDRAQANIKLGQYTEAVADATKAIELDPSNSKAYLRKGTACLKLEEYQTAKVALETGSAMASGDSRFTSLIKECEKLIAGHSQFFQFMDAHIFIKEEMGNPPQVPVEETVQETVLPTNNVVPVSDQLQQAKIEDKPKFRHEFYQKPEEVVVTILAKGIPAENVAVEFGEQILSVTIDLPGEDAYRFQTRLFGKIIREKCKFFVLSTKIEIRLAKAEQIHWTTLEFSKENRITQSTSVPASGSQRPSYPSSKPKRDWDKIEAEVKKEEKDEKLDGDAGLNKFFREIYKDADEDTRRAMQKSFVESNGTVLSTNWKEVGSKKVEGSPPDGMELKKWEI